MTEQLAIKEDAEELSHPFIKQMVTQLRALDSYGTCDTWSDAKVLDSVIMTKERRREIPIVGDPDETTVSRVKAFYNGIAQVIEKECSLMAVPMLNLSHEGFGRAIITVGKLVVLDKTLRDVHRFGFDTAGKMAQEAEKLTGKATDLINQYRQVAEL